MSTRRAEVVWHGPMVTSGFVGQVERSGQVCDRITDLLARSRPRPGALGKTEVLPAQDVFDPTLGGLVEVER